MRIGNSIRWIEFTKDPIGPDCFITRITSEGLKAEALVDFDINGDLAAYLADLARNWKGWKGTKRFETTELELVIEGSHDGKGHIELQVDLKQHPWSARTLIGVDAGDLERLSKDAHDTFKRGA